MSVEQLIKMSNKYGADRDYVIAGGGNTSSKEEGILYVKASGQSLATITESGLVTMHMDKLLQMLDAGYTGESEVLEAMMAARTADNGRPSVEALLHALFTQKYVLHVHPAIVNGVTCSVQGGAAINRIFGERAVWLDETRPGYTLSITAKKAMDEFKAKTGKDCDLMFIQNHGVFFAAEDTESIDTLVAYVISAIKGCVAEEPDMRETKADEAYVTAITKLLEGTVRFGRPSSLVQYLAGQAAFEPLSSAYSPDHIVYYGCAPLFAPHSSDIEKQLELITAGIADYNAKYGAAPRIICVSNIGFFAVGKTEKAADISYYLFLDALKIAVYAKSFGGHRFMADDMIDFIRNWEVESYRANASK